MKRQPGAELDNSFAARGFSQTFGSKFSGVRFSNSGVPHLRDPGRKLEGRHKRTEFGGPIGGSDGRLSASQKPLYNWAQFVTTDSLLYRGPDCSGTVCTAFPSSVLIRGQNSPKDS